MHKPRGIARKNLGWGGVVGGFKSWGCIEFGPVYLTNSFLEGIELVNPINTPMHKRQGKEKIDTTTYYTEIKIL